MTGVVNYIIGIYIKEITPKNLQVAKYDVKTSKKKESAKCFTYYNYISTELDLSQKYFKKALEKSNYINNECWINSLIRFLR
jgi:hypothetical protein